MSTIDSTFDHEPCHINSFYPLSRARPQPCGAASPFSSLFSGAAPRRTIPRCISKHPRPVFGPQTLFWQRIHNQLDLFATLLVHLPTNMTRLRLSPSRRSYSSAIFSKVHGASTAYILDRADALCARCHTSAFPDTRKGGGS